MDNYLYEEALEIIKKRHNDALAKADKKQTIAMQDEKFKEVYHRKNYNNFLLARLNSEENKNDKLAKEQKEAILEANMLIDKIIKELETKNKTRYDFAPVFTCKKCNDTGFYKDKVCSCVKEIVNKKLTDLTNIVPSKENNFKNFDESISPIHKEFKGTFSSFCKGFSDSSKSFIISGESGTGKTYLINCIYNELVKKGFLVAYHTAFTFNNMCSKYHTTFTNDRYFYLNNLLSADLLIIDDIGTEPILSNITLEYIYVVLNERAIRKLPTIITTNLSLKQLQDRYTERTIARIVDKDRGYFLKLNGKNLRK